MHKLDNLTAMMVFAKVVETLSYTEAAQLLDISKSTVSKEIAQLEVRLGARLLQRTTRRIEITEVGQTYYQYCARILNEMKSAELFIRQFHEEPIGSLHIVAPVTFGSQCVLPVVNEFVKKNIHINVDLDLTDRQVDLAEENVDMAVTISRELPEHALFKPLIDIAWGLYATPEYLQTHAAIQQPADLARHEFLLFRGPAHTISLPLRKDKQKLDVAVRSRLRTNNSIALLHATQAHVGIAYLPAYIADEEARRGSIVRVLPQWQMDVYKSCVQFRKERFNSPRIRLFVEQLQQALRRGGGEM